jgi:transketolase
LYSKVVRMATARPTILPAMPSLDDLAVASATAIPAHVVQAKGHGHAGTAMALAPLAHTLFSRVLRHNPADPSWHGRDRFVLSAGHASLLLYVQLHLTGYDLRLEELGLSRTLGSRTPGHPEHSHTDGVEMSTGPLGQGVASAVGMALAARREGALFGAGTDLFDSTVWVLAGDGCLQEGVSGEASSLAGTLALGNLVMIWDDNRITIDSGTDETFSEDVRARYRAYGWDVLEIADATDRDEIERVLRLAAQGMGAPTLVAVRSVIGHPSEKVGGTSAAHAGGFGEAEVAAVKEKLGFPGDAGLKELVPAAVLEHTRTAVDRGRRMQAEWDAKADRWRQEHPAEAERWDRLRSGDRAEALAALDALPLPVSPTATRKTNGKVLAELQGLGLFWGGSADLAGSTNVEIPGSPVSATDPAGDFVRFGIREHAMAAILSGIALHGLWRPFGSTYLVFSDYMRPSIRLAALMGLPVVYVFTHDSVAVGEDGPTHQPVEQIASLRTVPGLEVVRPADAAEVVAVWRRVLSAPRGPVAMILSRQDVPVLPERDDLGRAAAQGAYVAWSAGTGLDLALLATGSEVAVAMDTAARLAADGVGVRVISAPCIEWFEAAGPGVREQVLPAALRARVAVEAGRGDAWYRWVGLDGAVVSIEEFGESGSGPEVLRLRGISADAVERAARGLLA